MSEKEAMERMTPKAIKIEGEGNMAECLCPNCNEYLGVACCWKYEQTKYCHECGQALVKYKG